MGDEEKSGTHYYMGTKFYLSCTLLTSSSAAFALSEQPGDYFNQLLFFSLLCLTDLIWQNATLWQVNCYQNSTFIRATQGA
jgi:hypothetical protein